jgi:hypothetical protein
MQTLLTPNKEGTKVCNKCLKKGTGQAKDGNRARKGKGIRASQARVTKAKGGEACGRWLGGGHAIQGDKGLAGAYIRA